MRSAAVGLPHCLHGSFSRGQHPHIPAPQQTQAQQRVRECPSVMHLCWWERVGRNHLPCQLDESRQSLPASLALHCTQQSTHSECQHTSCCMRCALLMFMLLHGTDHERCTPLCDRSKKVSAAADRQPKLIKISMHSDSSQSNSMPMAISMLNNSIDNADLNGAVFMVG